MATRRAWFAYEEGPTGKPMPVVFYDDIPKSAGKRKILQICEIDEMRAEMSFHSLQVLYPYLPQQETLQSTTNPVVSEEMEKTDMTTRPVTGYLTPQGKFFESRHEADLYDARYRLNMAAGSAAINLGVEGEENIEEAIKALIAFINTNTDVIEEYIFARRTCIANAAPDGVDGPTTPSDPPDDPQVRDEDNSEVAPPAETEADPPAAGEVPEQSSIPV